MDIEKVKEAYRFAIEQCKKTFKTDRVAYRHFTTLAALAHVHLLQEGENADSFINNILGDEECTE